MANLIRRSVKIQTVTPLVTAASAYTANFCVGAPFEIKGATLDGSSYCLVKSIFSVSKGTSDPALLLILWGKQPAGTYTDFLAFNPSAADTLLMEGMATFGAAWKTFGTSSASQSSDLDLLVQTQIDPTNAIPGTSTSLWGQLVCTGTPTFATASDLSVKISIEQY